MADHFLFPDYDHIYLSPHLDDVALSCGGRIHQQTARGERVLVVTICAGDPPGGPLSDFAQELHDRWALRRSAPELRRAEDLAALELLGAKALHLSVPDCIYRRDGARGSHLYDSREAIFGPLHPDDWHLSLDVTSTLENCGTPRSDAHLYAPLSIGNHVDHQLTWRIADDWAGTHSNLFFYEDYPYAHDRSLVTRWIEGRSWTPEITPLAEADFKQKLKAIAQYRSQLGTFWPDEAAMAAALRGHAASVAGGEGMAERVWKA
ncbi:MAG: PIG-L family deacetylase [Chloroflexi bacterium]|nr:PIG-L family deacetylase [Chloroflexota bacterium]